jgi:hypothetical protein
MLDATQRNNRAFQASRTAACILGIVGCPSALSGSAGQPLSQSAAESAAPNKPTHPGEVTVASGASSVRWDFLGCLTGLLNLKRCCTCLKSVYRCGMRRALTKKSSEPPLKREGPTKRDSQTSSAARRAYEARRPVLYFGSPVEEMQMEEKETAIWGGPLGPDKRQAADLTMSRG